MVQAVKSVRDGSKARQRVVRHVGTASCVARLERLEQNPDPLGVDLIAEAAVMFCDATPLQFESELEGGDRFKGFSKDGRPHRVQVAFA